jgi:hypothetical protein
LTNPLITMFETLKEKYEYDDQGVRRRPLTEAESEEVEKLYLAASRSRTDNGRRLAKATLRTWFTHRGDPLDFDRTASTYTDDPFEAVLIGLALAGWGNDVVSAALAALGIEDKYQWSSTVKAQRENRAWVETVLAGLDPPTGG